MDNSNYYVLSPLVRLRKETLTEKEIEEVQNRYNPKDFIIDQDQIFLDARNLRIEAPLSVNFNVSSKCFNECSDGCSNAHCSNSCTGGCPSGCSTLCSAICAGTMTAR